MVYREGRAEHTARLVQHVKLAKLSPASVSCLLQSSLITAEAATTATTHQPEAAADTASRSRGLNKFIVAMAFDSSAVEYLDLDRVEEGWQLLTECPNMRYGLSGAGLVSMGDTLLVTGGVGRQGILKAINRCTHITYSPYSPYSPYSQFNPIPRFTTFNVRTNVWSEGPPMLEAR